MPVGRWIGFPRSGLDLLDEFIVTPAVIQVVSKCTSLVGFADAYVNFIEALPRLSNWRDFVQNPFNSYDLSMESDSAFPAGTFSTIATHPGFGSAHSKPAFPVSFPDIEATPPQSIQ